MAKEKISELDAAAALDGTELAVVVQGGDTVQTTTQDIADLGGGGAGYLVYTALLSQTGTDAPVATVLENTLGGTVVWSYDSVGVYVATLSGAFSSGKVWFSANTEFWSDGASGFNMSRIDNNSIRGITTEGNDDWTGVSIEIRVYP